MKNKKHTLKCTQEVTKGSFFPFVSVQNETREGGAEVMLIVLLCER